MNSVGNDLYNVAVSQSHLHCAELLLPVSLVSVEFSDVAALGVLYRALDRSSVIMISLMRNNFICTIKYNTNV